MDESRFPKKAYVMLLLDVGKGCMNWAGRVKDVLERLGFGSEWNDKVYTMRERVCNISERL